MTTWRQLFAGCWSGCQETIWTHDVLTCLRCGTVIDVLPQATVRGPAHDPEPVRGQPTGKAVVSYKVTFKKRAG